MPKPEMPRQSEPPSNAPLVIKLFPGEAQQIREKLAANPGIQMDEVTIDPTQRPGDLTTYRFTGPRRVIDQFISNPSAQKST